MSIFDLDNYTDAVSDAVNTISDAGDEIGGVLKTVSPVLGMVPGIGTAFSVAVYAAGAVAAGDKITDAVIGTASAAVPQGPPKVAFDGATNITRDVADGRSVVDSTLKACRDLAHEKGGAPAVAAFDSCIAAMHGGKIDQRLIDQGREFYLHSGGQTAASSYDAVVSIAQGHDADHVAIDVARRYVEQVGGPIAVAAFDGGVALGYGKTLQEAGYTGLHTLVKGQDGIEKIVTFVEQVGRARNLNIGIDQLLERDLALDFREALGYYGGSLDSTVVDSTLGPYIDAIRKDPALLNVASGTLAKRYRTEEAIVRQAQALLRSGDGKIDEAMLTNLKTGQFIGTFGKVPEKNVPLNDTYFQKGQSLIASGIKYKTKPVSDILTRGTFAIVIDFYDSLNSVWTKREMEYHVTDAWRRGFTVAIGGCEGRSERGPGQLAVYQSLAEGDMRAGFDAGQAVQYNRTLHGDLGMALSDRIAGPDSPFGQARLSDQARSPDSPLKRARHRPPGE